VPELSYFHLFFHPSLPAANLGRPQLCYALLYCWCHSDTQDTEEKFIWKNHVCLLLSRTAFSLHNSDYIVAAHQLWDTVWQQRILSYRKCTK